MHLIMGKVYWAETTNLPIPAHTILWAFFPILNSEEFSQLASNMSFWKNPVHAKQYA
jgi:hypothetical protein